MIVLISHFSRVKTLIITIQIFLPQFQSMGLKAYSISQMMIKIQGLQLTEKVIKPIGDLQYMHLLAP